MKAIKKNNTKEVDPRIQLTAQISKPSSQKSFTDKHGDEHVHFAQKEGSQADEKNTTAPAAKPVEAPVSTDFKAHPTKGEINLTQNKSNK